MAQIDGGSATGNAVLGPPRDVGNQGTEVHVSVGQNSLSPSGAPYVDPGVARLSVTGAVLAPVSTVTAGVIFANPS